MNRDGMIDMSQLADDERVVSPGLVYRKKEATGWIRVSMRFPVVIGDRLEQLAAEQGVSLSSICYTLMYWWTWLVYPPASERARREEYLRRNG
jgi:hypothetical protein